VLTFYAVLGVGLFNKGQVTGYDEHNDNFESFMPALLSLYVLTTEENFPFVADPALAQRPLVCIVYSTYIIYAKYLTTVYTYRCSRVCFERKILYDVKV
jgi:hypothetical protein